MDEKKWKRKMRYRKIRNAITAHVPRLILWGITLGSLAEMLFCVWACIEKYRPQAAAAAGLGLVSFIAGGAALAACRAPSTKIREKDAVVVENGSFVFGGNAFLAAASTALSILTVYLALEEVWGGIAVMGSMEILGKIMRFILPGILLESAYHPLARRHAAVQFRYRKRKKDPCLPDR